MASLRHSRTGKYGLLVFFRQDGRGTNLRRSKEETGGRDLKPLRSAVLSNSLVVSVGALPCPLLLRCA